MRAAERATSSEIPRSLLEVCRRDVTTRTSPLSLRYDYSIDCNSDDYLWWWRIYVRHRERARGERDFRSPAGGIAARATTNGLLDRPHVAPDAVAHASPSANTTSALPFFFFPSRITTSSMRPKVSNISRSSLAEYASSSASPSRRHTTLSARYKCSGTVDVVAAVPTPSPSRAFPPRVASSRRRRKRSNSPRNRSRAARS